MPKAPRNPATTVVYLVLQCDNCLLLTRRKNTGYADGNYQFPAGHIDAGELPTEALVREMKEELGIVLNPRDITLVHVSFRPMHDPTGDRVDFYFKAKNWEGEISNNEPHKCDRIGWFNLNDLPSNITPHVQIAIEDIQRGKLFSELGIQWIKARGLYQL